ncbi:aspartyl protease family protein [Gemmata sp.]|uniref:aspartyl protease family protein n=1 Tax=Gemmata sp. TaxID=1914242 RepID=UPI003F6EB2AC
MIFTLNEAPLVNPVTRVPLRHQPRPIVPMLVAGPNGRLLSVDALVDTGADEVIIPITLLSRLGFAPGTGIAGGTSGVGGRQPVVYHPVRLEIRATPNDRVAWNATVGFAQTSLNLALFGVAGGLEFFHATLSVIDRQLGLVPHPVIPLASPCVSPHVPFSVP